MAKENHGNPTAWLKSNLPRLVRNVLVSGMVAVAVKSGIIVFPETLWLSLTNFFHVWSLTLIGTIIVLLVGTGLFFFRKYKQLYYGLAEIGFAIAVAWTSIMRAQTTDVTSWVPIVGAAYLVVRGLSNYDDGRKPKAAATP